MQRVTDRLWTVLDDDQGTFRGPERHRAYAPVPERPGVHYLSISEGAGWPVTTRAMNNKEGSTAAMLGGLLVAGLVVVGVHELFLHKR